MHDVCVYLCFEKTKCKVSNGITSLNSDCGVFCYHIPHPPENLLPILFLEKGKQKREDIHFNLRGSYAGSNSVNNFKPLRIFSIKGMLRLEQEHSFSLG